MSTKNLIGILVDANDEPIRNALIRFLAASTDSTINTIYTDYPTDGNGAYDFSVLFGTYTIQIRRDYEVQYRTVCANVLVNDSVPQTLEQLIAAQAHIVEADSDVITEMHELLAQTQAAAAEAAVSAASVEDALIEMGNVDISSGIYPIPFTRPDSSYRSCIWNVSVAGTVSGVVFNVGDALVYSANASLYYKIDNSDLVTSVGGFTGPVTLAQLGLNNVDNTSDINKPISTATASALSGKSNIGHTHLAATETVDGFMSAADKTKLNTMDPGPKYVHPTSPITPGSYTKLDINSLGHATGGSNPSTLAELGVTDAFTKTELSRVLSDTPNIGLEDFVSIKDYGAIGDGTLHTLQEWVTSGRYSGLAAIQVVYPKATALTQSIDYIAIQTALDTGRGVRVPKGEYIVTEEIEQITQGQHVYFENSGGYGYGENIGRDWIPNTRIILKGTFAKRIRTRRLYRFSSGDPQDAPLSVGWNVQAEAVFIHNPCIWLYCDYSDNSPTNLGDDCDIGIFIGCRVGVQILNPQVIGYFRTSGIHFDATHCITLQRHLNKVGVPYPLGVNVSGGDGCHISNPYVRGARRALVVAGALPKVGETTYTTPYYDEQLGAQVSDTRGTFGFSDFIVDSGGRLYGPDHHSNRRLWDPASAGTILTQATMEASTDLAPCSMFIDGMAGNSSTSVWGMRFIGVRFATFEAFRIRLGHAARIHLVGCHIEGRNGGRFNTSGVGIDTNDYTYNSYGDVAGTSVTSRVIIDGSPRSNSSSIYPHYYGSAISSRIDYGTIYAPSYQPSQISDNFDSRVADTGKMFVQRFGTVSATTLSSSGYTFKGGAYSSGAFITTESGALSLTGAAGVSIIDNNNTILSALQSSTILKADTIQVNAGTDEVDIRSGASSLIRFRTGSITRATLSSNAFTCNVPFVGSFQGNIDTATKLANVRTISGIGDVSWSVNFDGSSDVTGAFTLSNTGVAAGSYAKVTTDAKGRIIAGSTLLASDIPNIDFSKITSGKPTTLAGYGITNAIPNTGGTLTGPLTSSSYFIGSDELDLRSTAGSLIRFRNGSDTLGTYSTSGFTSSVPFIGSLTGNASTATKWITPRSITIGGATKTLDGTSDITWTLSDLGALALAGGIMAGPITLSSTYITSLAELDLRAATSNLIRFRSGSTTLGTFSPSGFTSAVPFIGSLTGNSDTSTKLATARTLGITGDATWSVTFDGSADVTGALTLASTGVTAGSYKIVTVDAKGRVTSGSNPTTLDGFGITDALKLSGGTLTGPLTLTATASYLASTGDMDIRAAAGSLIRFRHGTTTLATLSSTALTSSVPFSGDLIGNASTATKWATARSITIGNTSKDLDGSAAVNWSIADIGALSLAGGTLTGALNTSSYIAGVTELDLRAATGSLIRFRLGTTTLGTYSTSGFSSTVPFVGDLTGNSSTSTKLATARTISITGDGSWSTSFDGSANVTGALTLASTGVTAGSYKIVTVDAKGRVTSGSNPTTLVGFGITDAFPLAGGATITGSVGFGASAYILAEGALDLRAATGNLVRLRQGSTTMATVSSSSASFAVTTSVNAATDNAVSSGTASLRWSTVYAGTGTINTSDERLKAFSDIDEAEKAAALAIKPLIRKFKFLDSIEEKGEENARWHFGVGAQTVGRILEEHGLDPDAYGFFCFDEWPEQLEELDEEGNILVPYKATGNRYSIRYDELAMFILSAI